MSRGTLKQTQNQSHNWSAAPHPAVPTQVSQGEENWISSRQSLQERMQAGQVYTCALCCLPSVLLCYYQLASPT